MCVFSVPGTVSVMTHFLWRTILSLLFARLNSFQWQTIRESQKSHSKYLYLLSVIFQYSNLTRSIRICCDSDSVQFIYNNCTFKRNKNGQTCASFFTSVTVCVPLRMGSSETLMTLLCCNHRDPAQQKLRDSHLSHLFLLFFVRPVGLAFVLFSKLKTNMDFRGLQEHNVASQPKVSSLSCICPIKGQSVLNAKYKDNITNNQTFSIVI